MNIPSVAVVLFGYGGVAAPTVESWTTQLITNPQLQYGICHHGAAVDRNRSMIASQFMENSAFGDVLVSIDHDMTWQMGDVERIAQLAYERGAIVGGVYSKRAVGKGICSRLVDAEKDYPVPSDQVEEATYVAGGFTAVARSVLEAVAHTLPRVEVTSSFVDGYYPFYLPALVEGEYLSEDWSFCDRARQAGFKSYVDFMPQLGHVGDFIYSIATAQRRP